MHVYVFTFQVVPGETALAFFTARNPTRKHITGVATYNVFPPKAGKVTWQSFRYPGGLGSDSDGCMVRVVAYRIFVRVCCSVVVITVKRSDLG